MDESVFDGRLRNETGIQKHSEIVDLSAPFSRYRLSGRRDAEIAAPIASSGYSTARRADLVRRQSSREGDVDLVKIVYVLEHPARLNVGPMNSKQTRPFSDLTREIRVGRVRFPFDLHIR